MRLEFEVGDMYVWEGVLWKRMARESYVCMGTSEEVRMYVLSQIDSYAARVICMIDPSHLEIQTLMWEAES